jgi:8-oxo-dGTP pyrophosphatase MutT (NUDIX family)
MDWNPHLTVATVVEHNAKYLLVEENSDGLLVYNQPAGHVEPGESLLEAAIRETLEETGWDVKLEGLVGAALYRSPLNGVTYYRTTFFASPLRHNPALELDTPISRALWLSYDEMLQAAGKMRSPLVIKAVEQYRAGHKHPLSFIYG